MEARSVVLAALLSLGLAACGGAKNGANADPKSEADLWAGYKGTYATTAAPKVGDATSSAAPSKKSESKAKSADSTSDAEAAAEAALAASNKKSSRGMINGESISTINSAAFANGAKAALKGKVGNSNMLVGSQYEQLSVSLKSGATITIVRPAGNPQTGGPSVASPKSRSESIGKNDASFYDEEADAVVIVSAGKKAASQKLLSTLVSK